MLCNCGRPGKYIHFIDGKEVDSCNKRIVCPTYDELVDYNRDLNLEIKILQDNITVLKKP